MLFETTVSKHWGKEMEEENWQQTTRMQVHLENSY